MESDDSGDEQSRRVEKILKIVVCGNSASGKTSLCLRVAQNNFIRHYQQTVGLDFFTHRLMLPGHIPVVLQLWDIGGQTIGSAMIEKYVYEANGAMFVYDVTNVSSFDDLDDWISIVNRYTQSQNRPPKLHLIGNKTDLEYRRTVRIENHTKFAKTFQMTSHYVSAKTGDSVLLMFKQIACEIVGIELNKNDIEADIIVVEASIATGNSQKFKKTTKNDQSINTAACSLS